MRALLGELRLNTVCQSAHCPNQCECFASGTATFMILGDTCTRSCRFCAVGQGRPLPPDPDEPRRVAAAAARLGLRHVVVTSVTRDDLADGGSGQFAATIAAIRAACGATVEVLTPDFGGSEDCLRRVLEARPDVYNHNVETVPRLYPLVRPQAVYERSLELLRRVAEWGKDASRACVAGGETTHPPLPRGEGRGEGACAAEGAAEGTLTRPPLAGDLSPRERWAASDPRPRTYSRGCSPRASASLPKSGLMVGLGETHDEVGAVMRDLRGAGCEALTIGQYLRSSPEHLPVERFVPPEEFEAYREEAEALGFSAVAAGPFVRSSYHADAMLAGMGQGGELLRMMG